MRVVQSPDPYVRQTPEFSVFLAGGITNCPDWQAEIQTFLSDPVHLTLINPRHPNFDTKNPSAAYEQIEWEFNQFKKVDVAVFWFPAETLCPIVLLEYGKWLGRKDRDFEVGCHPDYARLMDVKFQGKLEYPKLVIHDSLKSLANGILDRYKTWETWNFSAQG